MRRLRAAERKRRMLEEAMPFFAERGFEASTRALAEHLGVTQALLYKYFGSKDEFLAEMMELAFGGGQADKASILDDQSLPLVDRICAFYRADSQSDGVRMRLFVRAGLAGWPIPARRGAQLTHRVFRPLVYALRREAGIAAFDSRPMVRGERELAMMLHASIVFLGIREHVYRMPMPSDRASIVRLYVETYLPGALETVRRLNLLEPDATLAVRQLG